jgi:hypothetical protein
MFRVVLSSVPLLIVWSLTRTRSARRELSRGNRWPQLVTKSSEDFGVGIQELTSGVPGQLALVQVLWRARLDLGGVLSFLFTEGSRIDLGRKMRAMGLLLALACCMSRRSENVCLCGDGEFKCN